MGDLSLQIGEIDAIMIGDGEGADTRRGKEERSRATETTGTNDQRACAVEAFLSRHTPFIKQDVA